ncbi:hypothetical protein DFJ58DRAFT_756165 [Suillus subalutaceus]|uniref:uncharacterized protein n=1 Tax=Suillus subalutaceus TaxID=48586 RepID=UPI001B86F1F4|nr:uncharacterized protein DFJ58DRAFT_756165 [Suillus subalutaceus]KAG1875418.1 hypothetical protein DFJ58DRAFT_756165 [Suillus subalutaceus]
MRLKISTVHPLGPLKAWFALNDEAHTIAQLKCALCARLPIGVQADNMTLMMDEYDLLDESPISILRDGDAVCIKGAAVTSQPSLSSNRAPLLATQKRKRRASTSSEPSSSLSSSSAPSSSDSSEDSSSSSSSSNSDSDSDTDAPKPPQQPSEKRVDATTKPKTLQDNISFVPPGYGKPSTRNRNLRRRRKRVAEHNQHPDEPLAPTSGANAVLPLPNQQNSLTRTSSEAYVADAEPESEPNVMMISLRNKNKKKNFRQLMDKPLPPKIVFAELENAPVQAEPPDKLAPAGTSNSEKLTVPPVKQARLIPPSERDDLPSNIFVTSVDVEEGKRPKKKQRSKENIVTASYDDESCTANFSLDYGSAEVPMMNPDEALHLRAEQQWDLLPKLTGASQVKVDNIVAYKALDINPTTWTPEMLIKVARVISLSSTHITTSPLQRTVQVSFSGLIDATEADEEDETYTWADVLSQDWRIVR